jgi:hypothetical protein
MQNNPKKTGPGNVETSAPGRRGARLWAVLLISSTIIMAAALSVLLYTIFAPRPTARKAEDMMEKLDKANASIEEANTVLKKFELPLLPDGTRNIRIFFWRFLAAGVFLKCEMPPKSGDFYMNRASKGLTWENKEKNMREGLYIYWDEENNILYLHRSWS